MQNFAVYLNTVLLAVLLIRLFTWPRPVSEPSRARLENTEPVDCPICGNAVPTHFSKDGKYLCAICSPEEFAKAHAAFMGQGK